MNIEWFMAARSRVVYSGWTILAGALMGIADSDDSMKAIDAAYATLYGTAVAMEPLDVIERKIAALVDGGSTLPVSNEESYEAALWITQEDLSTLPAMVPRAFVLYLAKALRDNGKYPTMLVALNNIISTKTLV